MNLNKLEKLEPYKEIIDGPSFSGEEKKRLTKSQLLEKFAQVAGVQEDTDQVLLS